jgi:tetratricopeptide (TPR) repeat protein
MRSYLIRGVFALAVVLVASAPAAAQSMVRGTVVDAEGKPVEGATVSIQSNDSSRKAETKTDKDGKFLQIGLQTGDYTVTVTKDNMKQTLPARASQARPTDLAFQLTPTSGLTPEQLKAEQEMAALAQGAIDAMKAGRTDEAIKGFNDIILKIPTCSDCYYNLGVLHTGKQQYAEAEAAFKKVIELRPDSGDAYSGLANLYNAQKKFDLAQQASAKAAELSAGAPGGGSAEATYNQGVILWNAGNYAEAKTQFEAAIKADPNMAMAHYQLGMANLNMGQIPDARAAFEGYLKVDPNGEKAAEVKTFLEQLPK